uniref:BHLH domain-containing protein n=1 Tax=Glossina austeni TaxID=7395 RepID=A0A1A9UR12_GLOAU
MENSKKSYNNGTPQKLQLEDSGGESYQYHSDNQSTTTQNQQQHVLTASSSRQRHSSNMNQNGSSGSGSKHTTVGSSVGVNNGVNNKTLDNEKRMRREIANSNERRRMQSINAGFQNLRSLLPRHEGEKLSKNTIVIMIENRKILNVTKITMDISAIIRYRLKETSNHKTKEQDCQEDRAITTCEPQKN